MTFRRRSLALLVGLATLGASGFLPPMPAVAPSVMPGAARRSRSARRRFFRPFGYLPARKGVPQKRQLKACHHQKKARNRRRKARMGKA
ncbi:hypothetical protein [Dyella lutea]|uniref:Uncharacterized protein n=1 Tax=Dyella lutea TaxID=2950441 RepID=A0ABT1FF87_9GAMM|nr:hypothetical protein [Dyella lutea]MCP1375999.1 hypothetical protein [Dyella lutea]